MYEMTELEEMEQMYSELHKDVYGVKARWYHADSIEHARADLASLQAQAEVVWAREKQAQVDAGVAFEARVAELIAVGAGDRATALRWIHQAEGTDGDDERLCYALGLSFSHFKAVALAAD